ncbi:Pre-rRNA-processing protein ESF2 [Smittium culicis]|uniref:Pre-rRNA-processing protein ESF2 n=1 Tax=Smittium culicis TaxID=133412 RepID=A0A1R1XPM7_9FUNG|nr:Pre-rRNA-processing protein ESF2 [Smittium culicis]
MDKLNSIFESSKSKDSDLEFSDNDKYSDGYSDNELYQDFSKGNIANSKKSNSQNYEYSSDEAEDSDENSKNSTQESDLEDNVDLESKEITKKRKKSSIVKPLTKEELLEYQKKEKKSGVIYMSRVPPFLKPNKVRRLLSKYGEIGRLFLAPEGTH